MTRRRVRPEGITLLDLVRILMLGGRESRTTVARMGVSLPTADRWLQHIFHTIPGMHKLRMGKVSWFEWEPTRQMARTLQHKERNE
jgi:hypothetical protein